MADQEKIDWSQCSLVEVDSLVLSGAPVLRGTRMPANAIVDNYDYGMSVAEISEQFEVPEESIRAILTQRAIALPILFDKNVPIGVRHFLPKHEVRTVVELSWPQKLQNGELLRTAEADSFDVLVTCDQNIAYQQNLTSRKLALVVFGSNIWPIVSDYRDSIAAKVDAASPGSHAFIDMPLPAKRVKKSTDGSRLNSIPLRMK